MLLKESSKDKQRKATKLHDADLKDLLQGLRTPCKNALDVDYIMKSLLWATQIYVATSLANPEVLESFCLVTDVKAGAPPCENFRTAYISAFCSAAHDRSARYAAMFRTLHALRNYDLVFLDTTKTKYFGNCGFRCASELAPGTACFSEFLSKGVHGLARMWMDPRRDIQRPENLATARHLKDFMNDEQLRARRMPEPDRVLYKKKCKLYEAHSDDRALQTAKMEGVEREARRKEGGGDGGVSEGDATIEPEQRSFLDSIAGLESVEQSLYGYTAPNEAVEDAIEKAVAKGLHKYDTSTDPNLPWKACSNTNASPLFRIIENKDDDADVKLEINKAAKTGYKSRNYTLHPGYAAIFTTHAAAHNTLTIRHAGKFKDKVVSLCLTQRPIPEAKAKAKAKATAKGKAKATVRARSTADEAPEPEEAQEVNESEREADVLDALARDLAT